MQRSPAKSTDKVCVEFVDDRSSNLRQSDGCGNVAGHLLQTRPQIIGTDTAILAKLPHDEIRVIPSCRTGST